jgi:hypothetical protein
MLDMIAIEMALEKFRAKCPDSYKGVDDSETICAILGSAGMFGSMAARATSELCRLQANIDATLSPEFWKEVDK